MKSETSAHSVLGIPSKYILLVTLIVLFVLTFVGVLATNYQITTQFEEDAQNINLAGRQRMLSQRTAKSIQNLILAQQNEVPIAEPLAELSSTFDTFNKTFIAFDRGGTTIDASGNTIQIEALTVDSARAAINDAKPYWDEYSLVVQQLINSEGNLAQAMSDASQSLVAMNATLLSQMNDLTLSLENNNANPTLINIAGRQRMLSQRMTKSLLAVVNAQVNNQSIDEVMDEFKSSVELFDQTLNAFANGGMVTLTGNQTIEIDAIDDTNSKAIITAALGNWDQVKANLSGLLVDDTSYLRLLSTAQNLANINNIPLLAEMNALTVALEQDSQRRSQNLQLIQLIGIAIAVVLFLSIIWVIIRQLSRADRETEQAREETNRILATVKDGLFLMDDEFNIGTQHSQSLTGIINEPKPAGKSFVNLLRRIVPEKTLETAKDYLTLLMGDRVHEDLMGDLNPLDQVEVFYSGDDINRSTGHLGFSFTQVKSGDKVSNLLVQVDDITERVRLEKELQASQEKAKDQMDMMLQVLHVDPTLLTPFLNDTENNLKEINGVLQQRISGDGANRKKLNIIFQLMHRIKGDSAALGLESFEEKAHEFENVLELIREKSSISGKDFLPMTISLDQFMKHVESLKSLIDRLAQINQGLAGSSADNARERISMTLTNLVEKLANEEGKRARLDVLGATQIPEEKEQAIRDILTQLLRNSMAHGIEDVDTRSQHNKPAEGHIRVQFQQRKDGRLLVYYSDDGQGLSNEDILNRAIERCMITEEQAANLDEKAIKQLIFKPGFSTKDSTSKNAGRGVGMDVILQHLRALKSRFSMNSRSGENFEFIFLV